MSPLRTSTIASSIMFITSLVLLSGCGDKNSSASFVTDTGKHVSGWVPSGHKAAATTDSEACKECHGSDFAGGISRVSCTRCHLGGFNAVHPLEWGDFASTRHADYVTQNGSATCANAACHGSDLKGVSKSGPSCSKCHMGGFNAVHPLEWGDFASIRHANFVTQNGTAACANAACHGSDLKGVSNSGSSCSQCHLGGNNAVHPLEWGNFAATRHAGFVAQNGTSACANAACHGSDLKGVSNGGQSCSQCHMGGSNAVHPLEWGNFAATRHAGYVTQNGTSACANAACHGSALKGVSNSGPSCNQCHIGGTNAVHPLEWGNFAATMHAGFVTQNGTATCANAACHGSDLKGVSNSGPSCTTCHLGGTNAVHPLEWGNFASTRHSGFVAQNGTAACANASCHGSDLNGVNNSGPSCTKCHMGGNNAVHPLSWGNFAYARHAGFVTQNGTSACANTSCHGSDLNGVSNSGPSCTSCHMGGINSYHPISWIEDSSNHPSYGDLRACANITCHGAQLQGVAESGPSCTSCHN